VQSDSLDLWLHGGATLVALYGLLRSRPANRAEWVATANAAGVWLGSAFLFGLYFRYRNFYVLIFAWALLIAIGWKALARLGNSRHMRATLGLLLVAGLVVNLTRVSSSLPVAYLLPANFESSSMICRPGIDDEFALQWARRHSLQQEVASCRAKARCDPTVWELPYGYSGEAWSPSLTDHCGAAP
jgi:hypothetical protein